MWSRSLLIHGGFCMESADIATKDKGLTPFSRVALKRTTVETC